MANAANSANIGPYALRVQADGLFNANDVAQRLVNMRLSEAQTLRAVWGPTAYVPTKTQEDYAGAPTVGTRPGSRTAPVGGRRLTVLSAGLQALDHTIPYYGFKQHGIFHAVMASGREILLLHTGDALWEWRGWARNWRRIIATPSGSHGITGNLPDKSQSDFPTQFVFTGNGIAIVPQQGRAYFYDGHYIAPLGFASLPASPTARGPSSSGASFSATEGTVNDVGYAHSSADRRALFDNEYQVEELDHTSMTDGFGDCRLGTITVLPVTVPTDLESAATGWVNAGEWRCAAQYVDRWGNLSAMSTPSSAVTIDVCPSVVAAPAYVVATGTPDSPVAKRVLPSRKRVQIKWEGISTGPDHCIGRRLYRTKDTHNTGDTALY